MLLSAALESRGSREHAHPLPREIDPMRPLVFLRCVAKAAVKRGAHLLGLGEIVEQVWNDWDRKTDEAARKAELEALVQMAVGEFREAVEAVLGEVAGKQPAEVQLWVSN